jgi:hypothetical protein
VLVGRGRPALGRRTPCRRLVTSSIDQRPDAERVAASWWLPGLVALVLAFGAVTLWRSQEVGIGLRDPHGQYFVKELSASLGLFALLVVIDSVVRGARPWRGHRRAWRMARERW